ncbi:hypothetical protein VTN31DRAFT_2922 [Thermomyces dupontii]|uniref:uncharacterized protein n=1 Tax=Talaromyces thermophilus TaxID=28565 RepID=UPI0037438A7F
MEESRDVNYYEVLNIPFLDSAPLSTQQIKAAYHKALLRHHPDKASNTRSPASKATKPAYSVDDITNAYKTLIDPVKRAEYDRTLRLRRDHLVDKGQLRGADVFRTGLEVVDLEDLQESDSPNEEGQTYWYRECRCGDEKGFMVTEEELEKESAHGEIVVGCRGCSLWMKVLFAVQEDDSAQPAS